MAVNIFENPLFCLPHIRTGPRKGEKWEAQVLFDSRSAKKSNRGRWREIWEKTG